MIKINLLPKEQRRRKRVGVKRGPVLGVLGGVLLLAGMGYLWWTLKGAGDRLKAEIAQTRVELQRNIDLAKRVDQLKADKKRLQDQLAVIDRLVASQSGPVRLMDELSRVLPPEVWLSSVSKSANRLIIQGFAFSNFGIANFMTGMGKAAPLFQNVELSYSEKILFEKVPVERFEIIAQVES